MTEKAEGTGGQLLQKQTFPVVTFRKPFFEGKCVTMSQLIFNIFNIEFMSQPHLAMVGNDSSSSVGNQPRLADVVV